MAEQMQFRFPTGWGGARPGAGRPKSGRRSDRMPHVVRPAVSRHRPHHVTVRVTRGTWNLRSQRCFRPIHVALAAIRRKRPELRVVHFSVQHNHLHLLVEAPERAALSNGIRALLIRIARGLNREMQARGPRIADRFHEHILRTPTEARNALRYVLGNRAVHLARWGKMVDPTATDDYSSLAVPELVSPPGAWLLREGWTRAGP